MHMLTRMLIFLATTCFILFCLHYFIWARLARDTGMDYTWRIWAAIALFILGAMIPVGMLLGRAAPKAVSTPVMWVVYFWMGMMFFLVVLLTVGDIVRLFMAAGPAILKQELLDPERRRFLALLIGSLAVIGSFGLSVTALFGATARAIQLKKVKLLIKKLPDKLGTYRIAQITDLHVGPTIGREFIQEVVSRVNAMEPDLIAITGDLADGTLAQLGESVASLKELKAKDGVFFITGNHEYYTGDLENWLAWLTASGIRVLRNERVSIKDSFDLAGVDDWTAHGNGHGYT